MIPRFDFVLSYWIFVWYLLYMIGVPIHSPKFALLCGIFLNVVSLFFMSDWRRIFIFLLINMCIKVIPLYTLRFERINVARDLPIFAGLFCFYMAWMYINRSSVRNTNFTPMTQLILNKL